MESEKLDGFQVIGISVQTTNENNKSAEDITELWGRFMKDGILDKIPNKIDNSIYSIYTEYESDYMKPYTTILGCKVQNLDNIPKGMIGKEINSGNYLRFSAKGDLTNGIVYKEWTKIWQSKINRAYSADFEIYGPKAQNPSDAVVNIYVAIK